MSELPLAATFVEEYRRELVAAGTLVLSIVLAKAVDRALAARDRRLTSALAAGEVSPETGTRLRLLRRVVFAGIIVIGIALALNEFAAVRRVTTGVLASSAVLGLVVGFAARQVLANAVAGVVLAITQPIRVGDLVTFEEHTGTVEDLRLNYTYIRLADGRRLIIPNERLASSPLENHTIVDPSVHVEVSLWIPPDADATRALSVLGERPETEAVVAEVERDGIRLSVGTSADSAAKRGSVEAELRADCLERLRTEGLSFALANRGDVEP